MKEKFRRLTAVSTAVVLVAGGVSVGTEYGSAIKNAAVTTTEIFLPSYITPDQNRLEQRDFAHKKYLLQPETGISPTMRPNTMRAEQVFPQPDPQPGIKATPPNTTTRH